MLDLLLERMRKGNTSSIASLARDLCISQSQVELMVRQLEQMGYLKSANNCGSLTCTGCSKNIVCHMDRPVQLWMLTDREAPPQEK